MTRNTELARLRVLARAYGVQTAYGDVRGMRVTASEPTLRAMLTALGVPAGTERECEASLLAVSQRSWSQPIDNVLVAWDGVLESVVIRGFDSAGPLPDIHVVLEDGTLFPVDVGRCRTEDLAAGGAGPGSLHQVRVYIELHVPTGYHLLVCTANGVETSSLLIAAPQRCYEGEPGRNRLWGLFAPLYALRGRADCGTGSYTDLLSLAEFTGEMGGGLVGTLPLLPCYYEEGNEPSPYVPVSRLLWSEFYIDPFALSAIAGPAAADAAGGAHDAAECATLGALKLVDYGEVQRLKSNILARVYRSAAQSGALQTALDRFTASNPHVSGYAAFRAARDHLHTRWREWPSAACAGDLCAVNFNGEQVRFHEFQQWLAHEQMSRCLDGAAARGVGLYLDLPVGVHPDGYDTWRYPDSFVEHLSTGAPPDIVFTGGQRWGSPPLHPTAIREHHYDYVRAYLAHHMKSARMLRVDHVMGLHRLFCIPDGAQPSMGAYLRYRPEEWYAMLSLESHRYKTIVVGEDLGLVPREVRRAMACHGLRRMFVLHYEMDGLAEGRTPAIPANCLASINTHDMPTFAAMWQGLDICQQVRVGLLDARQAPAAGRKREAAIRKLLGVLAAICPEVASAKGLETMLRCTLGWLGRSHARDVMVNIEDLWLETAQQNIPGVGDAYPSWRHRAAMTLEELGVATRVGDALSALRAAMSTRHREVGGKRSCHSK